MLTKVNAVQQRQKHNLYLPSNAFSCSQSDDYEFQSPSLPLENCHMPSAAKCHLYMVFHKKGTSFCFSHNSLK